MTPFCRASLTVLCVLASAQAAVPATPGRSVSTSRQFLVYGADVYLRGAICDLAEKTKHDVLRLVDQRDEWTTPIVIHAQYPQANLPETPRAALSFGQTGFGLKLQLDLTIASQVSQPEVRREILRAILLEMIYRRQPSLPVGTAYVPPPDWLLDGIPPRQGGFDAERWTGILGAPVTAQKILPLEEFLRPGKRSGLDGPDRSLYWAYSIALVQLLAETPDGPGRLARFIADLPAVSNGPLLDLGAYFPELSNRDRAEKMWSSYIAQLATGPRLQLLSAEETERKLDALLVLQIFRAGTEGKCQLDEFPKLIRSSSSKFALGQCGRDLSLLAARANPIYRQVICEYATVATLLARGKTNGTSARLARVSASRKSISTTVRAMDDYLNWFEAAKSSGPSGAFADYMKAADQAAQREPKRRDPISVYLDVLEAQFQN